MALRSLLVALILSLAGLSAAQAQQGAAPSAPPWHEKTGLVFPDQAGGARLTRSIDYGKMTGNAGLGYSWHYLVPDLVAASIYVYDGGQRVPDGPDNALVVAQFSQNMREVEVAATQANRYRNLSQQGQPSTCSYGRFAFRCITYKATQTATNEAVFTRLMLVGYRGHYLKLRIDWPQNSAKADAEVERLVRALFSQ